MKYICAVLCLLLLSPRLSAQYVNKKFSPKKQAYTDSLKNVVYDYTFPILGQGAYKEGFDIPYPAGLMVNYIWMKQGVDISNTQLGLLTDNIDIPLTPVDFIEYGENTNTSYGFNFRPDLWILPFLNVYGIFGSGHSRTEVNLVRPVELNSVVEQQVTTTGFGIMTAFGIGPLWTSADANWTFNKPELLDKPVRVNVLGLRLGHTFNFPNHPQRNFAVWLGGMRTKMNSDTRGEIRLGDALPPKVWDRRDEIVNNYWDWYNSLDPNNIADRQKIKFADRVLTPIVDQLEAANGNSIIRYGLDKQVKQLWNGTVGAQYQFNKRWMLRSEAGVFGDRKSYLVSVNYRFLM